MIEHFDRGLPPLVEFLIAATGLLACACDVVTRLQRARRSRLKAGHIEGFRVAGMLF